MYLVVTSDGTIHEPVDEEAYCRLLDDYGPEVVDTLTPADCEDHSLND